MITPAQREQIRISILRYLDAAGPSNQLSTTLLLQMARNEGFARIDRAQIASDLGYLAGKGLIARGTKLISPEVETWQITSAGMDHFAATQADE